MNQVLETQEQVIRVAIDLFSTKGFSGTSIRAIAKGMGMSISNIYNYFVNKEGLMLAILQQSSKILLDTLHQVSDREMDSLNRFKLLVETHLRFSETYRKESKIFLIEEGHLSPEGNEINRQIKREILNLYVRELRILKELGYLGGKDLSVAAFNVIGVITWYLRWYRPDGRLSWDEVCKEIVSFVMHGLLGSSPQTQASIAPVKSVEEK